MEYSSAYLQTVEKLRQIRQDKGISQGQLAIKMGIDRAVICYWENRRRKASDVMLVKWARALNWNLEITYRLWE